MANGEYIGSNSKIIKNLNMFVGTLPEIKSKELKGTISYLEFLFATDTKEFYIGSRNGKAVCFGTGNAVNEDVIRQIAKEASADELQNIKTALQSILSEEISDEVNGLTASLTDAIKLINDNQITLNNKLNEKQNKLIAGANIIIDPETNVISAVGGGAGEITDNTPTQYKLYGKRLCILGDSISTFGTPDQSNSEGKWTYPGNRCSYPQSNLFTDVEYMYRKQLINKTGMVLGINESWAGSLVSNTQASDSGDMGPNRCISSMTRINHLGENGTPDIIVVYGGTNDIPDTSLGTFDPENPVVLTNKSTIANPANLTDTQIREELDVSTFVNAYVAMLVRLQYIYPDALIICMTPNYCKTYYGSNYVKMNNFVSTMKEICDYFGVPYIDLRKAGIGLMDMSNDTSTSYLPDGIHPGIKGQKYIFEYLYNFIMANYFVYNNETIIPPDPENHMN